MQHAPDQGVDLGAVDLVHALDSGLDLALVGQLVHDEHEGVVLLDLLHGRLGGQREPHDAVLVQALQAGRGLAHGLAHNLRVAAQLQGLRAVEVSLGADLDLLLVRPMAHLAARLPCLHN